MTQKSQEEEFSVLGCKVRLRPDSNDNNAKAVIDLVDAEVKQLRLARPGLRDTDVAVLVALKIATEKMQIEDEYKESILKLESLLSSALNVEAT
jgi:cell division protein ZapA (FtsZ GTPase activity inhibitor)